MSSSIYTGGWKSVFYSFHVANEVGYGDFWESIRSKNTCKTCAYGMGGQKGGMVNEAGDKIEICKKSMQAQLTDIQPSIQPEYFLEHSIADVLKLKPREIERIGRLNDPIFKAKGDTHYRVISWQQAIQKIVLKFKHTEANRSFFYSSGRSSNEAAYLLHLFARLYGTNNVNNCSYYCHQATGVGLKSTIGTGTATVELLDIKKADVIFVIGANPSSNHPRFLTELMHLRRRGGEVIVINPAKEPGMVKFSIPSDVRSFLTKGSEIASEYLQPKIGSDIAVLKGIAKYIIENDIVDHNFVDSHSSGFEAYKSDVLETSWNEIEQASGISKSKLCNIGAKYAKGKNVIFSWAMGITHHQHGVANVEAIANLAMLRGMLGRKYAGMMPLRGHSNVQGVGSVGVTPKLKEAIFCNIEAKLGIKLPTTDGWDTMKCMEKAHQQEVDLAFILGGNLFASNPNLNYAEKALNNIPFKVFINTTLNEGHFKGVDDEVIILPALARDEEQQPTSQESMFNYVRLSDGGPLRAKNARSEVDMIVDIAKDVIPNSVFDFQPYKDFDNIRHAIAVTVPGFEDIENLNQTKEEFHIKGRIYHTPEFKTSDGKAIFRVNPIPNHTRASGKYTLMSIRSEGQFNSIIYEEEDSWRGQTERWILMMNPEDMKEANIAEDQLMNVKSAVGEMKRVKIKPFDLSRGSIMGYYPETNILVTSEVDDRSRTPAFKNTEIWFE